MTSQTQKTLHPATLFLAVGLTIIALLLAYGAQSVWAQSGGPASNIADLHGLVCAGGRISGSSISPDGNWVILEKDLNGSWDLFLVNVSTGEEVQITTGLHDEIQPFWAPDSSWIVYVTNQNGSQDIMLLNIITLDRILLTNTTANNANPIFSPDGQTIIFQSDRNGSWDLFSLNLETGEVVQLTTSLYDDTRPAWASGSDWIVYVTNQNGSKDIMLLNVTTLDQFVLTRTRANNTNPIFGPDGLTVIFQSDVNGSWDLFSLTLATGEVIQLTTNLDDDTRPCLMVEPGWIAYQSNTNGIQDVTLLNVITLDQISLLQGATSLVSGVLKCTYIGDDQYEWVEADVTYVGAVSIAQEITSGPFFGEWRPGCPLVEPSGTSTQSFPVYNCRYAGNDTYQWVEAIVTYVDDIPVSEEIVGGPFTGIWQPGCPANTDFGETGPTVGPGSGGPPDPYD
jgi:TolB protein